MQARQQGGGEVKGRQTVRVETLRFNERNPRKITAAALQKLCESIRRDPEFMRLRPIVVDDENVVLGGNQRLRAIRELGMIEIPGDWVAKASDLTPEQRRRFVLVDNAPEGMAGSWDYEILGADFELPELEDLGFDRSLLDPAPNGNIDADPQVDRAAELAEQWGVKTGDLWALGEHRLLCGDSTKAEDVARVMGGEDPDGMIIDPPFDVHYEPWLIPESVRTVMVWARGETGLTWTSHRIERDGWGVSTLVFSGQARGWARPEWPCLVHEVVYVLRREVGNRKRGGRLRASPVKAYGLRVTEDDRPYSFYEGLASRRNDMSWAKNPATFAVWLCFLDKGELVYDPCAGSGASLMACEKSDNVWRGIEINPSWVALAIDRWQTETNRKAVRVNHATEVNE